MGFKLVSSSQVDGWVGPPPSRTTTFAVTSSPWRPTRPTSRNRLLLPSKLVSSPYMLRRAHSDLPFVLQTLLPGSLEAASWPIRPDLDTFGAPGRRGATGRTGFCAELVEGVAGGHSSLKDANSCVFLRF